MFFCLVCRYGTAAASAAAQAASASKEAASTAAEALDAWCLYCHRWSFLHQVRSYCMQTSRTVAVEVTLQALATLSLSFPILATAFHQRLCRLSRDMSWCLQAVTRRRRDVGRDQHLASVPHPRDGLPTSGTWITKHAHRLHMQRSSAGMPTTSFLRHGRHD